MAGMPNMFMEDTTVGGLPWFTWLIAGCLPKNKKKREYVFRIQMVLLTYITYSLYNMARRPLGVVKTKIIERCNSTERVFANQTMNSSTDWCKQIIPGTTVEEFMGILDAVYIVMYGICLFISGIIADCYNPRYYLTAGCLMAGCCCALLGLTDFWGIRDFRFYSMTLILFGAAQSTGWPVVLSSVTHWYSGGKRGMFFGFWNTHNYIGSMLGIYLAAYYVDSSWGWSFCIPGFILALMSVLVFTYMIADPNDLKELDKLKSKTSLRRLTQMELPPWLGSSASITLYDAILLPGVIEFSTCMFFSRMVGYVFLFWLPTFIAKGGELTSEYAAYYSITYVLGGSLGGIFAGILVDLSGRSALTCGLFLLISIPVLLLGGISELGKNMSIDIPVYLIIGLFVEAPYVVISTSVSADLGTHKMIKRNHRALSTIGGIVEGTGAIGAAIGTGFCGFLINIIEWTSVLYCMMALQFVATLCLSKQVYKDYSKKHKMKTITEYWKAPSIF